MATAIANIEITNQRQDDTAKNNRLATGGHWGTKVGQPQKKM